MEELKEKLKESQKKQADLDDSHQKQVEELQAKIKKHTEDEGRLREKISSLEIDKKKLLTQQQKQTELVNATETKYRQKEKELQNKIKVWSTVEMFLNV